MGIISPRIPGKPHLLELLGPHYLVRRFLVRLVSLVMLPLRLLNSIIPNPVTQKFDYWVGNFEPVAHLAPPYGLVIEVDGDTGEIVSSLHSTNGAVRFISEAYVHDRSEFWRKVLEIVHNFHVLDGFTLVPLTTTTLPEYLRDCGLPATRRPRPGSLWACLTTPSLPRSCDCLAS